MLMSSWEFEWRLQQGKGGRGQGREGGKGGKEGGREERKEGDEGRKREGVEEKRSHWGNLAVRIHNNPLPGMRRTLPSSSQLHSYFTYVRMCVHAYARKDAQAVTHTSGRC